MTSTGDELVPRRCCGQITGRLGSIMRSRRWVFVLLGVLVSIGVSSCAQAAGGRQSDASHAAAAVRAVSDEVVLTPAAEAGWAGWCMRLLHGSSGYGNHVEGCEGSLSHGVVLAERWTHGASPSYVRGIAVVQDNVAAVRLANGAEVSTRAAPNLPESMRVAVVEVANQGQGASEAIVKAGFTALNVRREVISRTVRARRMLGYEVRGEGWEGASAQQPPGICGISVPRSGGFQLVRGGVVSEARLYTGLVTGALLTCAYVEVALGGQNSLLGGVLINADDPNVPPGPLPGMRLLPGQQEIASAKRGSL
jgi:hypothetical protein